MNVDGEDEPNVGGEDEPVIVNRTEGYEDEDEDEDGDEDEDNLFGKTVVDEEAAYDLYNHYAFRKGFSIRTLQKRENKKGVVTALNFCCSWQGFKMDRDLIDKKIGRQDFRSGCKACIRFSRKNDLSPFEVSLFVADHNHDFVPIEERQFLRSSRKISKAQAGVIHNMVAAGISTKKTYTLLAEEVGGPEHVGFTKRDCYNLVASEKITLLGARDAQSLIQTFNRKQLEDPTFFYSIQVDQENRMTNFFWTDGRSQLDYECFGDVVVFDTTFRTNKYNMKCAPFVGVNHHWRNVLFGCAFLMDENTTSFVWLFETFLQAMGNKKPQIIFTDEDAAMAAAIKVVFPEICHRLCLWHISKNASKKIKSYMAILEFKRLFNKWLYGCESEAELVHTWEQMKVMFNVENIKWVNDKWLIREKWSPVFSMDLFSCMMKTSQRSESMNSVFRDMCKKTMTLTQFVNEYERQSNDMRLTELEEDHQSGKGQPPMIIKNSSILKHAALIYTRKLFKRFEKEFISSLSVSILEEELDGTFRLSAECSDRVQTVRYDASDCTIYCSCKMFESLGLLCQHALRVLNVKNVTHIPERYILKRWTKDAKKIAIGTSEDSTVRKENFSTTVVRNSMMRRAYSAITKASEDETVSRLVSLKITEIEEIVRKEIVRSPLVDDCNEGNILDETNEGPVLDPHRAWPKGLPNRRLKSCLEKQKQNPSRKNKQQKTMPTSNAPSPQFFHPFNQQVNPTCPPGYSNFGLTGIPSLSFTAMLQGTSLPSPHLNQNSSAGYPPGQYHHAMFSNLNQSSIAENPSDQYHPAMFSNLRENSSVAYPSSQHGLAMFPNLSQNSTACTRLDDYDSGQQ